MAAHDSQPLVQIVESLTVSSASVRFNAFFILFSPYTG